MAKEAMSAAMRRNLQILQIVGPVTRTAGTFRDTAGRPVRGLHRPTIEKLVRAEIVTCTLAAPCRSDLRPAIYTVRGY